MSAAALTALIRELNQSMLALATLGGAMRLQLAGHQADPAIADAMASAIEAMRAPGPATLEAEDAQQALGLIQTFFAEAQDLLTSPARPPGWRFEDPSVLQGIGTSSAGMVARLATLAETRPWFAAVLQRPGCFLDVGTGVGGIALAAAALWPALDVLGIDCWPPSLALARQNRAASSAAARVRFQHRALEEVDDPACYALAWLPTPFIGRAVLEQALPRLLTSLTPGGVLVAGIISPPSAPLAAALCQLRARRNGGHAWPIADIEALLRQAGFGHVETPPGQGGMQFVLARKTPSSETVP